MLKLNIIRGHPRAEFKPDGSIAFEAHYETWHAILTENVAVPRFSRVQLTARASSAPSGDHPENMHSRLWAGLGLQGEIDPLASSVSTVEAMLDYRGLEQSARVEGVTVAESVLMCIGLEIGIENMWPIANLPAVLLEVALRVTPPAPEPPPVVAGLGGYPIVALDGTHPEFYVVTVKVPKGTL